MFESASRAIWNSLTSDVGGQIDALAGKVEVEVDDGVVSDLVGEHGHSSLDEIRSVDVLGPQPDDEVPDVGDRARCRRSIARSTRATASALSSVIISGTSSSDRLTRRATG